MVEFTDNSSVAINARQEYLNPLPQNNSEQGGITYFSQGESHDPYNLEDMGLQIKIIDFDRSIISDQLPAYYIHNLCYCAPEILLGADYSYSADIWSLGVMVCLILFS
jgi:serine/threonine-protein kinase SRPK3